ncbi:hypothetical protein [Herpetosiphon giganteus]|uniref:hypothetical protein n=1 Tax=Herpetosiphon giganteus TaxID=2029754 RepID=UPI00195D2A1B|nr:hypothetical protein [Herpetosiphon giganteus]MBM7843612.1 hypothetical protein [Herpetosiphon giganteus]
MDTTELRGLLASLPPAVLQALESGDSVAFEAAFAAMPVEQQTLVSQQLEQFQQLQIEQALDSYAEAPTLEQLIDQLPPDLREAVLNNDQAQIQVLYDRLERHEQDQIGELLLSIQMLVAKQSDAGGGMDLEDFTSLLDAIVAATHDPALPRAELRLTLADLESLGWQLSNPVEQIWAGERDQQRLLHGLDDRDRDLINYILATLKH